MAFLMPISAVLSFTLTNIMFMRPMAAPRRVMSPMIPAIRVMVPIVLLASLAIVSL